MNQIAELFSLHHKLTFLSFFEDILKFNMVKLYGLALQ